MNQLIIIAHPKKDSFSHKIKISLEKEFINQRYSFKIRDLYEIGFKPVLTEEELKLNKEGKNLPDIAVEQSYIEWADELTFIYPLWWNAFPAILKGYIDRVFTNGFAFKINGNGPEGLLKNKKVRLITTAGMKERTLTESGIFEGLKITQEHGVFEFCGMDVLDHLYVTEVTSITKEQKENELNNLIKKIFSNKKEKV